MRRALLSSMLSAVLGIASATTGLAARCSMPMHCELCPDQTSPDSWAQGTECPSISPAAPRLANFEGPVRHPHDVAASGVFPEPVTFASNGPAAGVPPIRAVADAPPGAWVLRI